MAHTQTKELNKIPLGSGNVYIYEWDGSSDMPTYDELEVDSNLIGRTKNGATVEYTTEVYTAVSDDGKARKTKITAEEATMTWGLITWNRTTLLNILSNSVNGGTSPLLPSDSVRTKIGGMDNDNGKRYLVHFWHKDPVDGDIRITMFGKNVSGWSAAFSPNSETVLQPKFQGEPLDSTGALIYYDEEIIEKESTASTTSDT